MGVYPYEYARQVWVCAIDDCVTCGTRDGRCDDCDFAQGQRQWGAFRYEYGRQIWDCIIENIGLCENNGRCDDCELADWEKIKEAKFRLEGPRKMEYEV